MSRFDRAFLNQVLARTSIIDVVGRKVTWDKKKTNTARGDYWACCPFHGEKSPSFHALESKGQYHCFGCGQSGNAFDFLMETENMGFSDAVETLAQRAGIEVPKETKESQERASKSQRIMAALDSARGLFKEMLHKDDGKIARAYLKSRGIPESDWDKFGLGYSPNNRTWLKDRLTAQGFKVEELIEAGLLRAPEDGKAPYDLYRGRLMFSIEDGQGKTISFGARTLEKDGMPKYINGPETPVFSKGYNLYRYNVARARSRDLPMIISEGYMDVIALERAGFAAVAPLGTALTEDQLRLAWRACARPILCLDGDDAGKRAASRALERALPLINAQKTLGFVTLPNGQDPDDLIRTGGRAAMAQLIENPTDLANFIFENEVSQFENLDIAEARAKLRADLRAKINEIKDEDLKSEIRIEINNLFDAKFHAQAQNAPKNNFAKNKKRGSNQNSTIAFATDELRNMVNSPKQNDRPNKPIKRELLDIICAPILHPQLLEKGEEVFAGLETDNKGLDSLRHGILDIFHSSNALDFSSLKHHLTKENDTEALTLLSRLQKQPINPFVKAGIDVDLMFENWSMAVEKYMSKRALAKDAEELAVRAGAGEEDALLLLSQLVSERRRLSSEND